MFVLHILRELTPNLDSFCLSGCFSRPHALVDLASMFHNCLWFAETAR
jgi:hypothetical protein